MRLLDRVARCHAPLRLVLDRGSEIPFEVPGPSRYASRVANCPLRFVLGDNLTRACAELAFADGARLAGCLDLLRVPAPDMWVEWNDEVHQRVIYETHSVAEYDMATSGRRVGVLLQGSPDGYTAIARTFWVNTAADESSEVTMSPLETHIDLRGNNSEASDIPGILSGRFAAVTSYADAGMASLLDHVRFRLDASWAAYYRAVATDPDLQHQVIHGTGGSSARRSADARLFSVALRQGCHSLDSGFTGRAQSPRLHQVRGHLVRRDNRVFWRVSHLRGRGSRGMVRSRTVCLSFARARGRDTHAFCAEPSLARPLESIYAP